MLYVYCTCYYTLWINTRKIYFTWVWVQCICACVRVCAFTWTQLSVVLVCLLLCCTLCECIDRVYTIENWRWNICNACMRPIKSVCAKRLGYDLRYTHLKQAHYELFLGPLSNRHEYTNAIQMLGMYIRCRVPTPSIRISIFSFLMWWHCNGATDTVPILPHSLLTRIQVNTVCGHTPLGCALNEWFSVLCIR